MKKIFDIPIYGEVSFSIEKEKDTSILKWSVDLGEIGEASYGLIVENNDEGRKFIKDYCNSLTDEIAYEKAKELIDKTLEHLEISDDEVLH